MTVVDPSGVESPPRHQHNQDEHRQHRGTAIRREADTRVSLVVILGEVLLLSSIRVRQHLLLVQNHQEECYEQASRQPSPTKPDHN